MSSAKRWLKRWEMKDTRCNLDGTLTSTCIELLGSWLGIQFSSSFEFIFIKGELIWCSFWIFIFDSSVLTTCGTNCICSIHMYSNANKQAFSIICPLHWKPMLSLWNPIIERLLRYWFGKLSFYRLENALHLCGSLSNRKYFFLVFLCLCILVKDRKVHWDFYEITATSFALRTSTINLLENESLSSWVVLLGSYWKWGDYLKWRKSAKG